MRRLVVRTHVKQIPTDDIYFPLHFMDQIALIPISIMNYTFRYEDVLDANKLHDSLTRLLEIGDWRKLGGRLCQDVSYQA